MQLLLQYNIYINTVDLSPVIPEPLQFMEPKNPSPLVGNVFLHVVW